MKTIKSLFSDQRKFQESLDRDLGVEKRSSPEEMTKTLSLALYSEVSQLVSSTNYKSHYHDNIKVEKNKILFESVDIVRYAIAILNQWEISAEDFEKCWNSKDCYLKLQNEINARPWRDEKVAIVDMDDVLVDFRQCFSEWIYEEHSIQTDVESSEYYFIDDLEKAGLNPEDIFEDFVRLGGFLKLRALPGAANFTKRLRDLGYYVQILTARPKDNPRCFYDTFSWLTKNDIYFDSIDFSNEKLRWCAKSKYWNHDRISFAIDDSPKHAAEYAKHGINVLLPKKPYNKEVQDLNNIISYDNFEELLQIIKREKNATK